MGKDIKNIGVVTWFNSLNYGTCLQCYSLTAFLEKQGYYTYVPESFRYYYGFRHPLETVARIAGKIKEMKNPPNEVSSFQAENMKFQEAFEKRKFKNREFAYKYNHIFRIRNRADFKKMCEKADLFITGSDQIWNPDYVTPPYLLSFVKKGIPKLAYASSIGMAHIPEKKKYLYKKYLKDFSFIGVREQTAEKELMPLLGRNVVTVLDPSFLLTEQEWAELTVNINLDIKKNEKYIFCYFIGTQTGWYQDVKKFAEKRKCKIYCALSESKLIPECGTLLPEIGVLEFIKYLQQAEYIVTDSFHATALAINLRKKFVVYKRFADSLEQSQNSRIIDLLEMFDCKDRIKLDDKNGLEQLDDYINYENILKKLKEKRKESQDLLLKAIQNDKNSMT